MAQDIFTPFSLATTQHWLRPPHHLRGWETIYTSVIKLQWLKPPDFLRTLGNSGDTRNKLRNKVKYKGWRFLCQGEAKRFPSKKGISVWTLGQLRKDLNIISFERKPNQTTSCILPALQSKWSCTPQGICSSCSPSRAGSHGPAAAPWIHQLNNGKEK